MKAVVTKENFKKALNQVSHIVGTSSTLPILGNILLQTEKGRLKLSSTNLEIGLNAWIGGRVDSEGEITLPAKTINDFVGNILDEQISLELKNSNLHITTDSINANVKTLPAEDFPLIPKIEENGKISLPSGVLKQVLSETIFAVGPMEIQPELSGIYIYKDDDYIYFVATDRYRLVERRISLKEIELSGDFKPLILPGKTAQEAIRLSSSVSEDEKVEVIQGENQIQFKFPDTEMVSRLIDGEYPDYKQLIPEQFGSEISLPRYELLQAIKSASLFSASGKSVKIEFDPEHGSLNIYAASGEIGDSAVKINGQISGETQENTFNHKYLTDYLNNISDENIVFKAVGESSPAILQPQGREDNLYLVMPIKS